MVKVRSLAGIPSFQVRHGDQQFYVAPFQEQYPNNTLDSSQQEDDCLADVREQGCQYDSAR